MLIAESYRDFLQSLSNVYYEKREAENIANWVFEELTNKKKYEWQVVNKTLELTQDQTNRLTQIQKQIVEQQTPIQYVFHKSYFAGLELYVNKHVLIPRPETEDLVNIVSAYIDKNQMHQATLVDIGTGSGCMAIALKKTFSDLHVYALEEDWEAIKVAQKNALQNKTEITFCQCDILNPTPLPFQFADMIVSNPPYIPHARKDSLAPHVRLHEPAKALFVADEDCIIFYKKIIEKCLTNDNQQQAFFFEIDDQAIPVLDAYCKQQPFHYSFEKDRFNQKRFLICQK